MLVLLAVLYGIINYLLPILGSNTIQIVDGLMPAVIMLAGILIMLSACWLRMSNGIAATLSGALLNAVGWIFRQLIGAVGWLIRQFPALYAYFYRVAKGFGLSDPWSNVVAGLLILL